MANRAHHRETVSIGDVEIVTCVDGDGPSLVMLPSYGRDGLADFDPVADHLVAEGWRVLRPQPRGVAGSSGPMQGLDLKDLAGDIAGVVRHFGNESVVVLGHAFGNFVARVMAVEHPELVRGIILAAASASPKDVPAEINETPFIAGDPGRPEAERLAALRLAFFAPGHDARPWLEGWYPETLATQRHAVRTTNLESYWSAGTAPILEIIARCDPFQPQKTWSALQEKVGDRVTTVIIAEASHALFPEQPDRVGSAISQWISDLRAYRLNA